MAQGGLFDPIRNERGALVFHGSKEQGLKTVSANPSSRQYDNATSQFGAFFSPTEAGARHYAGETGRVYRADVNLRNPHTMRWNDFAYFQNLNKGKNGESLPTSQWGARAEELKAEAVAMRQQLAAAGHDGIIVVNRDGLPIEIASFADVQLRGDK